MTASDSLEVATNKLRNWTTLIFGLLPSLVARLSMFMIEVVLPQQNPQMAKREHRDHP
jgi:hypothetical protein